MWKNIQQRLNSPDAYVSLALGLAVVLVMGMIAINYMRGQNIPLPGTKSTEQSAEKQERTQTGLPTKYTVKTGDTLWSIAETFYKSGYNWVDLQKENGLINPDHIEVGQILTVPNVTPIPTPAGQVSSASIEAKPEKKSYTVQQDDTLWGVSLTTYGNGYRWMEIAQANNLSDPDLIYPGNVLTLP